MNDTRINELTIQGKVKEESPNNEKAESIAPSVDKESIIEECLERMKNYLKYESER